MNHVEGLVKRARERREVIEVATEYLTRAAADFQRHNNSIRCGEELQRLAGIPKEVVEAAAEDLQKELDTINAVLPILNEKNNSSLIAMGLAVIAVGCLETPRDVELCLNKLMDCVVQSREIRARTSASKDIQSIMDSIGKTINKEPV